MASLLNRMTRAAKLDVSLYEEVEADPDATGEALLVVLLSSIASGVATAEAAGLAGLLLLTVATLVSWYIWALLTYLIGTKILPAPATESNLGELLRTIGFASSPGLIRVIGIIPGLTSPVMLVASVWMLAAMVVAVRQALDYESTWRAVGVCLIGWVLQALIVGAAMVFLGGPKGTDL